MDTEAIKTLVRPAINLVFILSWIVMIFCKVDYPNIFGVVACLSGLEWITERSIKRFKEMFGEKK